MIPILSQIWEKLKFLYSFMSGWIFRQWLDMKMTIAERRKETEAILESQRQQFKREADHEERLSKISDPNLSDSDASQMLSSYPTENTQTQRARTRNGAGRKLPIQSTK